MPRTLHPNEVRQLEIEKALEACLKALKKAIRVLPGSPLDPTVEGTPLFHECWDAIAQAEKVARPEGGTDAVKD